MNNKLLFEIIKKEIRDVIRDKKTLMMMIVVPLVLYPVLFGAMMMMEDDMMNIEESEFNKIGFTFETDEVINTIANEIKIEKVSGNKKELKEKLENEEINAYLTLDNNNFTLYYSAKNTKGQMAVYLVEDLIETYKTMMQSKLLEDKEIDSEKFFNLYTLEEVEITGKDALTELIIGMIPTFIIMTTTLTAIFAAIDMTAGEKERGTLETLLTFPLKKEIIIGGKFIATTLCTMVSAILGFLSMYGVMYFMSGKLDAFNSIELLNAKSFICAILVFIVYSMLISIASIVLSSSAKSFKEAQNLTQPLSLISILPMFMSMMGTKLNETLAVIPFINVNLLLTDIISNAIEIKLLLITIISSIVFILILLKIVSSEYKSDKILFQ